RLRAAIRFDADDRRAAFDEAQARFVAGEAASIGGQAPYTALTRAINEHDWESMLACFTPDAAVRDHRVLGIGAEGPDQLVTSLRAQAELSPGVINEVSRLLAWNRHGRV